MLPAALATIAFVGRITNHGWMLAKRSRCKSRRDVRKTAFELRSGRALGRITPASEFYDRRLAVDGDTLLIAGRGELWAYRLTE